MLNSQLQNLLLPLSLFTLIATVTPGPNNILLSWCGIQFGIRKTIAFLIGIRIGVGLLFLLLGLGVGTLIMAHPHWHLGAKLLGAAYLIYLAIKMLMINTKSQPQQTLQAISMKQGVLLQFINPKAMMVVLSCVTTFSLPGEMYLPSVFQAFIVFTLIGTLSNSCWVLFGVTVSQYLSSIKTQLIVNRMLALLTLFSVVLLLVE